MPFFSYYKGSGGGGGTSSGLKVPTGPLLAGDNTIIHNLDKTDYIIQLRNPENIVDVNAIYPDPADPTNKVIINVVINLPGGLDLYLVCWT